MTLSPVDLVVESLLHNSGQNAHNLGSIHRAHQIAAQPVIATGHPGDTESL